MKAYRVIIASLLAIPSLASSDDLEPLIGTWVSPDGFARQSWSRTFDDSLVETKMWFKSESGWRLVASGAVYRRPGESEWRGVSRTRDMDGIELFESTFLRTAEQEYRTTNVAYQSDGARTSTEEEWVFDGPDRFRYTIFRFEDGERIAWMKGEWVRAEESE